MTRWVVSGVTADGTKAFAFDNGELVAQSKALEDLPFAEPHIRLGDVDFTELPAPVLPTQSMVLPGWQQNNPVDVISPWVRLWIAGLLATRPNWDGVVCACHGDVTHWIHISAREAISAQSALTRRLITALSGSIPPDQAAVSASLSRPEKLASHLRAAELSGNAAAISGHLVGAELASTRPYWLGQDVVLIANEPALYVEALTSQAVPVEAKSVQELEMLGLLELSSFVSET